jgi:hypothetical protein
MGAPEPSRGGLPHARVDPIFQFEAISGHRVATLDAPRVDRLELTVMRRAAELLPARRRLALDRFGTVSR